MYRAVKEEDLKRLARSIADFSSSLLITLGGARKAQETIAETTGCQRILLPPELLGEAVLTENALHFDLPGPAPSLNELRVLFLQGFY